MQTLTVVLTMCLTLPWRSPAQGVVWVFHTPCLLKPWCLLKLPQGLPISASRGDSFDHVDAFPPGNEAGSHCSFERRIR